MFAKVLICAYYLVAIFYFVFGILLLSHPHFVQKHLKPCFPLLASYRYQQVVNSLNLITVGLGLLIIGKLLEQKTFLGFFIALILSGLEIYLSIAFYYYEEKNVSQAIIHFFLHIILIVIIGAFILSSFSSEISELSHQTASLVSTLVIWNF